MPWKVARGTSTTLNGKSAFSSQLIGPKRSHIVETAKFKIFASYRRLKDDRGARHVGYNPKRRENLTIVDANGAVKFGVDANENAILALALRTSFGEQRRRHRQEAAAG